MPNLTPIQAHDLVASTLIRCKTAAANAQAVARALVAAEMDGLKGHGLSRVPTYAAQAKVEKVDVKRRFELHGRVGQGSMSKVWRATDTRDGTPAAIKLLPVQRLNDPDRGLILITDNGSGYSAANPPTVTLVPFGSGALATATISGGTVADHGVCFNYFGGAQSVTAGTFTIVWDANGLAKFTL